MAIKKYINTKDVVELTGRTTSEVLDLAKTGVLPAHKTRRGHWRYNVEAIEKYFDVVVNKPIEDVDKPVPQTKPQPSIGTRLITNKEHYQEVIERICKAKSSIKIMTGDFNRFRLKPTAKQGKHYKDGTPFISYLIDKARQGVPVQIILSDPTKNVKEELDEYFQQLNSYSFETRNCIRNHAKVMIIDDKIAYIGSANMTKAGLGQYKQGNFEAGILTDDPAMISSAKELFSMIWNGDRCEDCYRAKSCIEY